MSELMVLGFENEMEAEAVGLHLVLEAEYHQFTHLHSLSW